LSEESPKLDDRIIRELLESDKKNRYLRNRSEDRDSRQAVLDRDTLFTLYGLMNRKELDYLNGVIQAGKEGRVYWGVRRGEDVAVKLFYMTTSDFKKRMIYMAGDPRFTRVRKYGHGLVIEWARKEFANLKQAHRSGVRVPEPITLDRNVLIMEFIGEKGVPAPTLQETEVTQRDYAALLKLVERLYKKAGLVHADLSGFNVFKLHGRLILFDFGSAVDVRHPMSAEFLKRDIDNVNTFFAKRGIEIKPAEQILEAVGVP
jgi:RIO kinase 1